MKIKIIIKSNFEKKKIEIDTKTNQCLVNNVPKSINTYEFAKKLCIITLPWKQEYYNPTVIDGESFLIEIVEDSVCKKYVGFNDYPANYNQFLKLITEVIK